MSRRDAEPSRTDSQGDDARIGRRSFLKGLSAVPLLGALPSLLAPAMARAAETALPAGVPEHKAYYVKGTYFESCSCDAICPCLLLADPTQGYCKALPGWHIQEGRLGDLVLDDLNVVAFLHAPTNMTKGNWRLALYVDDRATPEQYQALTEIWSGKHGGFPAVLASLVSENMGARQARISWMEDGKHRVLKVDGVGEVDITQVEGADGAPVVLSGTPLAVAPPYAVTVSRSNHWSYRDHGVDVFLSGTSGLSSPFVYSA